VTTQISELGRAQRRVRAVAPVSDRAAVTAVEPVPRIALTQQEACASPGCSEEFFVEQLSPHLRVARSGWQAGVGEAGLVSWEPDLAGKPCPYAAGTGAIGRSSQRTSPALMLALSFGDRGGFRGA
jgi:hypothetical protein